MSCVVGRRCVTIGRIKTHAPPRLVLSHGPRLESAGDRLAPAFRFRVGPHDPTFWFFGCLELSPNFTASRSIFEESLDFGAIRILTEDSYAFRVFESYYPKIVIFLREIFRTDINAMAEGVFGFAGGQSRCLVTDQTRCEVVELPRCRTCHGRRT